MNNNFLRRYWIHIALLGLLALGCAGFLWAEQRRVSVESEHLYRQTVQRADATMQAILAHRYINDTASKIQREATARSFAVARKTYKDPSSTFRQTIGVYDGCGVADPGSLTVVINKKHCFTPLDWTPPDLQTIEPGHVLRTEAAIQYRAMQQAATMAGVGFSASSSYRSYTDQVATYRYWVEQSGQAEADKVSAKPGYSEHQTGLAVDMRVGDCYLTCFGTTSAYNWLQRHAAKYGFIQRYPENLTSITGYHAESWHWRYVGATVALDMQHRGIQTLEAYYNLSGGDYQW